MIPKNFDFGGYATRHDLECSDGRVIRHGAFKNDDGKKVPLVYHHIHDKIDNVLGHAILQSRDDGVYAYCTFNNSEKANLAKEYVRHGDITALSIYANKLKQHGSDVVHGVIREVSLVLSGANPGAFIDNVAFQHGDDFVTSEGDAIIYTGLDLDNNLNHSAKSADDTEDVSDVDNEPTNEEEENEDMAKEKTVKDVIDEMTDEQRNVLYAVVGAAVEETEAKYQDDSDEDDEDEMAQSAMGGRMNVFDGRGNEYDVLSHSEIEAVFTDMKRGGTLKDAMLSHGITDVELLFPEAQSVNAIPEMITRQMDWVDRVLGTVRKSPFSRIKSTATRLTAEDARARGYVKGNKKADQVIVALNRTTTPQTIYKKQTLDRDDIVDITDFDVVSFIKAEMRVMLNEELARAVLIGDGRDVSDNDKINPMNIRPIWGDDPVYTHNAVIMVDSDDPDVKAKAFIDAAIRSRKEYKGSGSPTAFIGSDMLTECRMLRDANGYRLYKSDQELADELRVKEIVEVELLDSQVRMHNDQERTLAAIFVNLMDYTLGADKGGEINNFEDFDIDFNQMKYLIETRASGALTKPLSALTFEFGTEPETP